MLRRRIFWPVWLFIALLFCFLIADRVYPLGETERTGSVIVLAQDDAPLRAFADSQGVWRYPVTLDEVSPLYLQALLTYEDRWFYYHPGINPLSLLRAGRQWLESGRIISGGSTLTMQVARILYPHPRSIHGKLRQMFRAFQLEWHYSKDEILAFYLNLAPFGGPIEGVQTASYAYLHKPVSNLSHAEAALLAVLPQAPSRLRPDRHPERAQRYRDKVLSRMGTLGVWEPKLLAEARMESVFQSEFRQPMTASLFARRIKDAERYQGQSRIRTALDMDLQWAVENIVRSRLSILPDNASAAVLVMENATGLVRAYVGSADFFSMQRAGHVDMVQALRSPGSTLKPFLYGQALDEGLVHSASLLSDAPLKLSGYAPRNFLGDYRGAVTVAEALQLSLNVPAVDLLQRLTPATFDARLQHGGLGLHYPDHERANLSLILGGAGARLEDLVRGFSGLARQGLTIKPRLTTTEPVIERQILSAEASWVIARILRDVAPPPGFSARAMKLSWKTGTSYGFRDAWSVGFNERYTVGVWTGRPDGTPLPGRYGARAAGPLLFEVFQALPPGKRMLKQPATVVQKSICWPLGGEVSATRPEDCHQQYKAWIVNGQIPPTLSSLRNASWSAGEQYYWINPLSGLRVSAACHHEHRQQRRVIRWPYELRPWLSAELIERTALPAFDASCPEWVRLRNDHALAIQGFDKSSQLQLPLSRGSGQGHQHPGVRVHLEAVGGDGDYLWLVNGVPVGVADPRLGLKYVFTQPGEYELTVLDDAANVDKVSIRVIR